jgi:hypothetical protein
MKPTQPLFLRAVLIVTGLALTAAASRAQLIDSYDADTLSLGTVTSWTDETGSQNATATSDLAGSGSGNYTLNSSGDPTAANTNAAFNGHTYVDFGSASGLVTADALFSGSANRSVAAVYTTPTSNAAVNPIAGQVGAGTQGVWFMLQARTAPPGSPYLAGFNDDDSGSAAPPVANELTFALATYDQATAQETVYWAFGLHGAVNSLTMQLGTVANPALDTTASPFDIGFDSSEPSVGDMQVGQVLVYENALSSAAATNEIESLQDDYGAPEPSTCALVGASLLAGVVFLRRRASLA